MFEHVQPVPDDPILGLLEVFRADPRPQKVNLTVGVYQDEFGQTPILRCVREAEQRVFREERSKEYLGMAGHPAYGQLIPELLLGNDWRRRHADLHTTTLQTVGGSGAVRLVADFLRAVAPGITVWISDPTWPNHLGIFGSAGLATQLYRYYDVREAKLDWTGVLDDLGRARPGDVVVIHGCCHNPSGADPTPEVWSEWFDFLVDRRLVPILDFAYQGFAQGMSADALPVRMMAEKIPEFFVCVSFSKSMGLYRERAGALLAANRDETALRSVAARLKLCVRTNYSNPPGHAGSVSATILESPDLRAQWEVEVSAMRERLHSLRRELADALDAQSSPRDFQFLRRQQGMFALTGLSPGQVQRLRDEFGIYLVGNGRMNLAGLNPENLHRVVHSFAQVL